MLLKLSGNLFASEHVNKADVYVAGSSVRKLNTFRISRKKYPRQELGATTHTNASENHL